MALLKLNSTASEASSVALGGPVSRSRSGSRAGLQLLYRHSLRAASGGKRRRRDRLHHRSCHTGSKKRSARAGTDGRVWRKHLRRGQGGQVERSRGEARLAQEFRAVTAQDLSGAPNERGQLDATTTALDHSVPHHDKSATMRDANQVTFLAAELTAPYHPKIPADVARLDFDGRELEIWSAAHNIPKLKHTAEDIHHTWDQVRPQVEAHNGQSAAKGFDALVAKVDHAHTAAQYHAVAKPLLDQVDKLENVF